ncbi:MAG: hypothetical protein ABI832_11975 [bacterium]
MWNARATLFVLVLAACEPVAPDAGSARPGDSVALPVDGTPVITVSSGGFFGSVSTQIFAGDVVASRVVAPGAQTAKSSVQAGRPGVFADAVALLEREGPAIKRAVKPTAEFCMDYGTDMVQAVPPVRGFDQVSVGCPDTGVTKLIDDITGVLAAPHVP